MSNPHKPFVLEYEVYDDRGGVKVLIRRAATWAELKAFKQGLLAGSTGLVGRIQDTRSTPNRPGA